MQRKRLRPRQRKKAESTKSKISLKIKRTEYYLDRGDGASIFDEPFAVMVSLREAEEESADTIDLPFGKRTVENSVVRVVLIVVLALGGLAYVIDEAVALAVELEHAIKTIQSVT